MATTVKKTKLTLKLEGGATAFINLPEPVNDTLTDLDTGDSVFTANDFAKIAAVYESDDLAQPVSASIDIITTTTNSVIKDMTTGA